MTLIINTHCQYVCRIVALPTPDLGEEHITPLPGSQDAEVCNRSSEDGMEQNSDCDTLSGSKRVNAEQSGHTGDDMNQQKEVEEEGEGDDNTKRRRNTYEVNVYPPTNVTVARAMGGMKGHTAFLTFAICPDKNCANAGSEKL